MLLAIIITLITAATTANAATAKCPRPRNYTNTPAETVILEVYDSCGVACRPHNDAAAGCETVTNKQMRDRWEMDEYDLTGYDCDHIIDRANVPGLPDNCGRDIIANKIPASSWWNRALGSMCWDQVNAEKRRIYGDNVVDSALAAVMRCCDVSGAIPGTAPPSAPTHGNITLAFAIIGGVGVPVIIMVIVAVTVMVKSCSRPRLAPVVA